MRLRLIILSLLPLLFTALPTGSSFAQDSEDPFGNSTTTSSNPFGSAPKVARTRVQSDADDVINALKAQLQNLSEEFKLVVSKNSQMKEVAINAQSKFEELRLRAEEAESKRNEMHQALFESLIMSDDPAQQRLAFEHIFACGNKYEISKIPINVYTTKLLQRVSELTGSESEDVRWLASRCLFTFKPNSAIELGFQFGGLWRPVEHVKQSAATSRIHDTLQLPFDLIFEEEPLSDFTDMLQMDLDIGVRIAKDVDKDMPITFKSTGRKLSVSLSGMLEAHGLGFAVIDEEIAIMKESDPALNITATYNIAGLSSLAKVKSDKVIEALEQSLKSQDVELTLVGKNLFTATTTEPNQRKIQEKLASLAPAADWYTK